MPIDEHVLELVASVSRIETKVDGISESINGTVAAPGLAQRVDDLEASRDKMRGVGIVGGAVLAVSEFLFHWFTWHKGGK